MRITIDISKRDAAHITSPHTFFDCCSEVERIMNKVQKEADKMK